MIEIKLERLNTFEFLFLIKLIKLMSNTTKSVTLTLDIF